MNRKTETRTRGSCTPNMKTRTRAFPGRSHGKSGTGSQLLVLVWHPALRPSLQTTRLDIQLFLVIAFSLVQGTFSSKTRGARAQYYPISPPDKDKYNPMCDTVNLAKLPLRGQNHYWRAIERLESATNKTERQRIV